MTRDDEYIRFVQQAMMNFQMIEEALKICVGMSYEVLDAAAPEPLAFKFDRAAIDNTPLQRLIKMFSQVSNNGDLVNDLKGIVKWRNFCAHNAYIHEFMHRTGDSAFGEHGAKELSQVFDVSVELVNRLGQEIETIRAIHKAVIGHNSEDTE